MATGSKTLKDLFLSTLRDIYDAERQILKALPKMADAASSDDLRDAFETHQEETTQQVERLEQVFAAIGEPPRAKRCAAIRAIIAEGDEAISHFGDAEDGDLALAASAQAVEHYEIARYGTLKAWAEELGNDDAAQLLNQTLQEETSTDRKLDALRQRLVGEMTGESPEAEYPQNRQASRSLRAGGAGNEERPMARDSNNRERDDNGRFISDDDNRGSSRGGNRGRDDNARYAGDNRGSSRGSYYRERDEDGRFTSDGNRSSGQGGRYGSNDDYRSSSRGSSDRDRDENGRFMSDDDRDSSRGGNRNRDDEGRYASSENRGSSRSPGNRSRDEEGRFASDDDYRSSSRGRSDDDDYRGSSRSGGNRQGGWFGDSEGHSEAARRGWEGRDDRSSSRGDDYRSRSRSNDDDYRSSSRSHSSDDDNRRTGGWFGDSEGHSEASRRGWQNSDHGDSGWYGDSEGHSEASRRGWENRDDRSSSRGRTSRDDDNRSSGRGSSSRSSRDDDYRSNRAR